MKPSQLAIETAKKAWPKARLADTQIALLPMNTALCEAFAEILDEEFSKPWLGNATTGQLLDEIKARVDCNYRTVDQAPPPPPESTMQAGASQMPPELEIERLRATLDKAAHTVAELTVKLEDFYIEKLAVYVSGAGMIVDKAMLSHIAQPAGFPEAWVNKYAGCNVSKLVADLQGKYRSSVQGLFANTGIRLR